MPPRRKASVGLKDKDSAEDETAGKETAGPQKKGRGRPGKDEASKLQDVNDKKDGGDKSQKTATEKVAKKRTKKETDDSESDKPKKKAKEEQDASKKEKVAPEKTVIKKSDIKHADLPSKRYKIVSWNVTTLRSLLKKNPELLKKLMEQESPDLICFQETKLKPEEHEEYTELLNSLVPGDHIPLTTCDLTRRVGYEAHFNSCTANKSYSGTLVLVRSSKDKATTQKQTKMDAFLKGKDAKATKTEGETACPPLKVTFGLSTLTKEDGEIAAEVVQEGRTITIEFESFCVVATYVPNSGEKLQRLGQWTKMWDRKVVEYLKKLEESGKPVIWCGDLNVAHLDNDIWNIGAKVEDSSAPGMLTVIFRSISSSLRAQHRRSATRLARSSKRDMSIASDTCTERKREDGTAIGAYEQGIVHGTGGCDLITSLLQSPCARRILYPALLMRISMMTWLPSTMRLSASPSPCKLSFRMHQRELQRARCARNSEKWWD
eukprot:762881-Hanusia_phi.AAC.3